MGPPPLASHAVIAKVTLAAWKDYLTMAYLGAVFAAFALGQLHALVRRRATKVSAQVFARGKLDDDERAVGEPTMPRESVMNWPSAMPTNWREVR